MLKIGNKIRYRLATILATHWKDFVANERQWIRPVVFETVRKIISCRTPILGCHVYRCDRCKKNHVVPHSCKSRFCPSCGKLATDRWADSVLNELLDVPYHHVVMSVPWHLRAVIAFNRSLTLNLMVRAATACLKQWAEDQHGMRMGIVVVIHTFGGDMKWHPHLHLLITEGGLSLDGSKWIRPYNPGWLMNHAGLKKMWRYHCITAFRKAHKSGQLRFSAKLAFLKEYPCFNKMLSEIYKLTWYVHIGASLLDPRATVRYIGRYTKRAVLAEYRITGYDGKTVRFAFKDYAQDGKTSYKTLPIFAFIKRLIRHIPDKHFKMIRYAGIFATRWKSVYIPQARAALENRDVTPKVDTPVPTPQVGTPVPTSQVDTPPSTPQVVDTPSPAAPSLLPWRQRQIATNGTDPLLCRFCQRPMRLVGIVFGSHEKIAGYFEAAGIPTTPNHPAWEPGYG